jgi:hypothetical protein
MANPYENLPSFPVPPIPGVVREEERWREDHAQTSEDRHQSGGLSDEPDDGGPRATSTKPSSLR